MDPNIHELPPSEKQRAEVFYEKTVTIDDVVKECVAVWNRLHQLISERYPDETLHGLANSAQGCAKLNDIVLTLTQEHPDLCKTYPLITRYMANFGEFSPKAVRKFLEYVKTHYWNTEDEFLSTQAMYPPILFRTLYKKTHRAPDAEHSHQGVLDALKKETESFKNKVAECEKEEDAEAKIRLQQSRAELAELIAKYGADLFSELGEASTATQELHPSESAPIETPPETSEAPQSEKNPEAINLAEAASVLREISM
ncbi:MAG: hypothetical protein M0R33_13910 [Methylomonas sp.]|jgi:hypothetical protein|uniref:hypothetical protein n=1 Tax=Methylomonas sp. TaxID=418 RepID=UPI002600B015|nr:hypothetical protein [Methylomonas sp.]MCK9607531.1 hypothetical protein [Methylomonas sp.]